MSKHREDEILRGYVKLVQAMFLYVFDRIRIKDSWRGKKLSPRMIERKKRDLEELGEWLQTKNCEIWFDILGQCTGNNSRKMLETFRKTHAESVKFIEQKTVDKKGIDL